jgi:simple sugar transport system permease protein
MLDFLISLAAFLSPLLMMASGSLCAELSGRVNMALEGQVLLGSFAAALVLNAGGNPLVAFAAAALASTSLAVALSLAMDRFKADPILAGLSANLMVLAGVGMFAKLSFHGSGTQRLRIESLQSSGEAMRACLLLSIAIAFFFLMWALVSATRPGLRLRAIGSGPEAGRASGVNAGFSRAIAFACSGIACGLAGCALVLDLSAWYLGITGGKGWLALAAMYVGGRTYPGLAGACLLFAVAESAANLIQGINGIPQEWSLALPFVVTLLFLAFSRRGSGGR